MGDSVPVRCPECLSTQAYAAPVFPCACGSPVAAPVAAGAVAEPITHRNWTDEWVTVRCGACGREGDWPHPELGCQCGAVLRVPVRTADALRSAEGPGGPGDPGGAGDRSGGTGDPGGRPLGGTGDPGGRPLGGTGDPGGRPPGGTGAPGGRPGLVPPQAMGPAPTPSGPDRPAAGRSGGGTAGAAGTAGATGTAPGGTGAGGTGAGDTGSGHTLAGGPTGADRPGTGVPGRTGHDAPAGPADHTDPVDHTGPREPGAPPRRRPHRTFAERYPAHVPLPPTAPHPAPARGAFRPVTIRTGRDAVAAAAAYLRWLGFREVVQPEERPASGVDLRAPGLVAQVDPSTRPTGLRVVECLWLNGLSTSAVSAFFSLAGYTPEARSRAAEIGLPLFVLDLTGTPQPVNRAADDLAANGA
ncbi:hypothetical protein [Streptomyces sp. NPDC057250]|uniref:hypothetical protein n=1 Tax=Streptomyces sp. NPDC057250 TaxID=3346068 RepID=UPI003626BD02